MAHYKETEKGQGLFLTVNLSEQILPGTYEHTLNRLIDEKLDLSIFDSKYSNEETGAAAIKPEIMLKIILYCYSLGIISSRKIAKMSKENMAVKALAEDTEPHYTTISNFVSGMSGEIEKVFSEVLMACSEMGLIKGKMFAIDGCRLPSNASKEWSGTMEELKEKYGKIKKTCSGIIEKHKNNDRLGKKEKEEDEKTIKQNLKIKRFYGNSKNAVMTQVWTALIAYLLFYLLKMKSKISGMSFTNFISVTHVTQRR